ncbi:hypothetical protein D3C71_1426830 [compost metagenome]
MLLPAAELPDVAVLKVGKAAHVQRAKGALPVIGESVIQRGEAGLVQHGRPNELVVEVLVDIADHSGQLGDAFACSGLTVYLHFTFKITRIIVWNKAVEQFAQRRFAAAVAANDRGEFSLLNRQRSLAQYRQLRARICKGDSADFDG